MRDDQFLAFSRRYLEVTLYANRERARAATRIIGLSVPFPFLYARTRITTPTFNHETAMFEDSFKNLVTAKSLGMSTVFVRSETAHEEGVGDAQLATVDSVVNEVRLRPFLMARLFSGIIFSPFGVL